MTQERPWSDWRQGDSFALAAAQLCPTYDGPAEEVILVSQTCDVVQATKANLLVAPLESWSATDFKQVRRGQRPLQVPLEQSSSTKVALLEHITAIPRERLNPDRRVAAPWEREADPLARTFARRLGHSLSRFAVPPESESLFYSLKDKIKHATGKNGSLGNALNHVVSVRVSAKPHWHAQQMTLTLYFVVDADQILPEDLLPPSTRQLDYLTLQSVCDRLASESTAGVDRSELWSRFGDAIYEELIQPHMDNCPTVEDVHVEVLSEAEFTFQQYRDSESIHLESLSLTGPLP